MEPRVTVIIPVHNGSSFVGDAVQSILSQSLKEFRLVVVDDASTDETRRVLEGYEDERLVVLRNSRRKGVSQSRNRGLAATSTELVAFLDADDIAYADRLQRQVSYLEEHPDVVVVGSHVDYINATGKHLFSEAPGHRPCEPAALRRELLHRACILPSTATGRTDALRRAGGFPAQAYAEDHELWCKLALAADLAVLPDRLVAYRQHPEQATFKKIGTAHRATQACVERARSQFMAAGVLQPGDAPPPLTAWRRVRGAPGSLGAAYTQWAEFCYWALREPRRAVPLAGVAVLHAPLSPGAWRVMRRSLANVMLPARLTRALRWYGKRLRDVVTK